MPYSPSEPRCTARRLCQATLALALVLPALVRAQEVWPPFAGQTHDCMQDAQASEQAVGGFYEGWFEDGTRFQINLPYAPAPDPEALAAAPASYWRSHGFDGQAVPLTLQAAAVDGATSTMDGDFVAVADCRCDLAEGSTRRFAGRFSADRTRASGTSSRPGGRILTFELIRVAEYHAMHLEQTQPPSSSYIFDALWPVLADAQLTAQARRAATACQGGGHGILDEQHGVSVVWHGNDSVSLRVEDFLMPVAAAHPGHRSHTLNFAGEGGGWQPRELDAVLDPAPACRRAATDLLERALRDQDVAWPSRGGLPPHNFLALPQGLVFFFDPAEVDASVAGDKQAFVPARPLGACMHKLPRQD